MPKNSHKCQMMLVGLSQLEGWDGGGGGQRQSPDIPKKGKLRTVWGLARWRGSHLRTASSDLRGMPPEGRLPLRGGEDVVGLGFLAGVFCLELTMCPLTRGAIQDHANFHTRVPRTNVSGNKHQEKGNWVPSPPSGGGKDETILRGNGELGEEVGESPRELPVH